MPSGTMGQGPVAPSTQNFGQYGTSQTYDMPPPMNTTGTPSFWTYNLPPPIVRPPAPVMSKTVETPSLPAQSQATPSAVVNSIDSGSHGPVPVYWSTPVVTSSTIQPA